jgi:hypothetical protein
MPSALYSPASRRTSSMRPAFGVKQAQSMSRYFSATLSSMPSSVVFLGHGRS